MKIPTIIVRLKTDAEGIVKPGVEYLARDPQALFHQAEWSWVEDIDGAWHFEDTYPAELHLSQLKADGVEHAHTMVIGSEHRAAREERRQMANGEAAKKKAAPVVNHSARPRISPEESYARTQRYLGEHD